MDALGHFPTAPGLEKGKIWNMADTDPKDPKFIAALILALKLCIDGADVGMIQQALENVKAMALEMNPGRFDYAVWVGIRVLMAAQENPTLINNLSLDGLDWHFGLPCFENKSLTPPKSTPHTSPAKYYPSPSPDTRRSASPSNITTEFSPLPYRSMKQISPTNSSGRPSRAVATQSTNTPAYDQAASLINQQAAPFSGPPTMAACFGSGSIFQISRERLGIQHVPSRQTLQLAAAVGMKFNPNYHGDLMPLDIENALCPRDQNCAIRIENIAASATEKEIFAMFTEGKIFSFSKKDPIPGHFENCAARLVFTTRAAAEAFHRKGNTFPYIWLHGHRFRVKWNRDACRPVRDGERHQSRVIRVMGPRNLLHAQDLENLFHSHIKFKLVNRDEWLVGNDKKIVELSFCSILGQSRIAYKFFHEFIEACNLVGQFSIGFGPDPCQPFVPTFRFPLAQGQGYLQHQF